MSRPWKQVVGLLFALSAVLNLHLVGAQAGKGARPKLDTRPGERPFPPLNATLNFATCRWLPSCLRRQQRLAFRKRNSAPLVCTKMVRECPRITAEL
jgi:hypothetical protein